VGVLLGVIGRDRTGCADDIECPQLHSSLLATSHWFIVDGQPRSVLPLIDDEEMGWSAAQRIYQCLEGWLAISCRRAAEVDSLLRVVLDASPDPHDPAGTDLAEPLAYQFFGRPALEWERDLRDAGVPCAVVDEAEWYSRYLLDDANLASGRVAELDLADHGRVRMVARLLEFDDVPFPERSGAPSLGADNEWVHHSLLAGQRTPTRDARTA
jgi:crotonobetainyl-CoA:carnitine CoA-transferase CaiB-like acyl-CoA transferase